MNAPLLTTKTTIPRTREDLIPRPRLVDLIDQNLNRRLILVSAPAGFGKTTLVASWTQMASRPAAWLSVGEIDNDVSRFLRYVLAAFQGLDSEFGLGIQSALESAAQLPTEVVLAHLTNEIASLGNAVSLVLDDYHLIEEEAVHQALEFLVHHLPNHSNIILISRVDPPIPLSRLRAGGELAEIRSNALRFSQKEAASFLNGLMKLGLSEDDTSAIATRTEGWPAGIKLAALSLQGSEDKSAFIRTFSGGQQYIIDYLMEEVLAALPEGTRGFLVRTSFLDEFCAPLCDEVLGIRNSRQIIRQLERDNLFLIPLDDARYWYRFHHLFVDFLRYAARGNPEESRDLHRRAAQWFERQNESIKAIELLVRIKDYPAVLRIIDRIGMPLLEESELATLTRLIRSVPRPHACRVPWVCVYHAWALRLTGGGYDDVESLLDCSEQASGIGSDQDAQGVDEANIPLNKAERIRLRAHITAIKAYQALYREDIPSVIRLAKEAIGLRPQGNFLRSSLALAQGWAYRFSGDLEASSDSLNEARSVGLASNNTYLSAAATCRLAYNQMLAGNLGEAAALCHDALRIATLSRGRQLPVAGYAHIYLGAILRERNELESARQHLLEGIALCQQVGYVMDQIVGHCLLARVLQASGEPDSANEALAQAEQLSGRMRGYLYAQRWVDDCRVRLLGAQDRTEQVTSWVERSGLNTTDELDFMRELEHLILARALVYLARAGTQDVTTGELLSFLERLRRAANSWKWVSKEIEILVLHAMALQLSGDGGGAANAFEKALSLANAKGFFRVFLDEGESILGLLRGAHARGHSRAFCQKLLDAMAMEPTGRQPATMRPASAGLVEPLSKREVEVLKLLATDLSGPEIANQLIIAVSTFRYHTHQIYSKLGVHSRREAISRGRALHLI